MALRELGHASDRVENCCIRVRIGTTNNYAFAEFRTNEDANATVGFLNGMTIGECALRLARPKGWVPPTMFDGQSRYTAENALLTATGLPCLDWQQQQQQQQQQQPMRASAGAPTSASNSRDARSLPPPPPPRAPLVPEARSAVVSIHGVPTRISDQDLRELLSTFGRLVAFNCVQLSGAGGASSKTAVFEYADKDTAARAMERLVGVDLGGGLLQVESASPAQAGALLPKSAMIPIKPAMSAQELQEEALRALPPTRVLRLLNMVTREDLEDDQSYEELLEDVTDECTTHGAVDKIVIPREGDGLGAVFVQFADTSEAQEALRRWAKKVMGPSKVRIQGTYFPVELFDENVFRYSQ
jgi:hypothetical protein